MRSKHSSERKTNAKAGESEQVFRTIADQSPNMIFINAGGRVVYANKRCEELTGYTLKEFYSPKFSHLTLTAPEYKELVHQNFLRHMEGKEVEPYEYAMITKNGKRLNTILSTKLVDYKGGKAILGMITDITEKKRAEEALVESEKKYRTLFEQMQDAIALVEVIRDKNGVIVDRIIRDANPAFIKLAPIPDKTKLIGKTLVQMLGKETADQTLHYVRNAMSSGQPEVINDRIKVKGKYYDFTSTIIPINENIFLSRTTDITSVMEQNRKKDEFISIASHELKTPLTSLVLYSQILKKNNTNPHKHLPKVHKQIERLNYLVNELLDVSKLQTNSFKLNKELFSLIDVVNGCVENIRFISPEHKLTVSYDRNIKVFADKGRVEQVIINLLTNAVKYSPDTKKVIIVLKSTRKEATIGVKDHGIGIDSKNVERIFDRFFRATTKSFTDIPGFGMGLFISKEIVRLHGGKIWVESKVGKGSTFYFSIPRK